MNTSNYQVWEGEMEAAGLEENGVSFFSAFFSTILGILLFFVLMAKTIFAMAFGIKSTVKRKVSSSLEAAKLNMSVS
jgi:hypothetical protein